MFVIYRSEINGFIDPWCWVEKKSDESFAEFVRRYTASDDFATVEDRSFTVFDIVTQEPIRETCNFIRTEIPPRLFKICRVNSPHSKNGPHSE